jgi:hypothetical protein
MAGHELIAAQLHILQARLPAAVVAELADGLDETYQALLPRYHQPAAAARAAIAEFGDADTITVSFVRNAPSRRLAIGALATAPMMGAIWGAALISQQFWNWPVPLPIRFIPGIVLLATVTALLLAVTVRRTYRRGRRLVAGAAGSLIGLDIAMIAAVWAYAVPVWPAALAIFASLLGMICLLRAAPALLRA